MPLEHPRCQRHTSCIHIAVYRDLKVTDSPWELCSTVLNTDKATVCHNHIQWALGKISSNTLPMGSVHSTTYTLQVQDNWQIYGDVYKSCHYNWLKCLDNWLYIDRLMKRVMIADFIAPVWLEVSWQLTLELKILTLQLKTDSWQQAL